MIEIALIDHKFGTAEAQAVISKIHDAVGTHAYACLYH